MKIFEAYKKGFILAANSKKMASVIYIITFLSTLLLAIPFRKTLSKIAGNSMALNSMINEFNFTAYSDFLRTAGKAISPFISAAIWFGIFYLIFTIFFSGGILKILSKKNQKFSAGVFFKNCSVYFFRFLRLSVYLIILQFLFAFIIFMSLSMIVTTISKTVENEAVLFYVVLSGIFVYLFFFLLILTVGDYAKVILFINDSRKSLKSIWLASKFVVLNFLKSYLLYLLLLIVPVLIFAIYFYLDNIIGMTSTVTVLFMFLVQQILVWSRAWTKIWILGSELSFYKVFPIKEIAQEENDFVEKLQPATDE